MTALLPVQEWISEIARGEHGSRDLDARTAQLLYDAMLAGQLHDVQVGAILAALRMKGESDGELAGFYQACRQRLPMLPSVSGMARPVVLPTYNGARRLPNMTPLLALLLVRMEVPVLVHGHVESGSRVGTFAVLHEMGWHLSPTLDDLVERLLTCRLGLAEAGLLFPQLQRLLALRQLLGVRSTAHSLVKMLSPFAQDSLRVVSVSHPAYLDKMRMLFESTGETALVMRGTEGEPFVHPRRVPEIGLCRQGEWQVLLAGETGTLQEVEVLPELKDAAATARWTESVLAGEVAVPVALRQQLACCAVGCGLAGQMEAATTLVAELCDEGLTA